MSLKRQRTDLVVAPAPKRPIDKQIINLSLSSNNVQQSLTLFTCTYPNTVTGLRWDLTATNNTDEFTRAAWAIVLVREGDNANGLDLTNGQPLYEPEQNVMTWGCGSVLNPGSNAGAANRSWIDTTKTMRKMMTGDTLVLVYTATETTILNGAVQFFLKG